MLNVDGLKPSKPSYRQKEFIYFLTIAFPNCLYLGSRAIYYLWITTTNHNEMRVKIVYVFSFDFLYGNITVFC